MNEDQIKYLRDRFLGWKMPADDLRPDNGLSYTAPHGCWSSPPTGTNLLDAQQADTMVRYMVEGMPETPVPFPYSEECCPGHVASKGNAKICGNCGIHVDSFRPSTPNNR